MARARLEWQRGSDRYTVIDSWSQCLVIQTTSLTVAQYWQQRVNACGHPIHYDCTDHDLRVEAWQDQQNSGADG